mmetsp:Transcript_20628/g.30429  ORF Transcript_20628/g.30429 Transcript_20628/m.30429 type:complete len:206 (-) Transcript_20628:619-1236(-)
MDLLKSDTWKNANHNLIRLDSIGAAIESFWTFHLRNLCVQCLHTSSFAVTCLFMKILSCQATNHGPRPLPALSLERLLRESVNYKTSSRLTILKRSSCYDESNLYGFLSSLFHSILRRALSHGKIPLSRVWVIHSTSLMNLLLEPLSGCKQWVLPRTRGRSTRAVTTTLKLLNFGKEATLPIPVKKVKDRIGDLLNGCGSMVLVN